MPESHSNDTLQRIKLSLEQRLQLSEASRIEAEKRAEKAEKRLEQAIRHGWGLITDLMSLDEIISRAMKKAERG